MTIPNGDGAPNAPFSLLLENNGSNVACGQKRSSPATRRVTAAHARANVSHQAGVTT
jgi:hypothetical protein